MKKMSETKVSIIRKYQSHTLPTNTQYHEVESQTTTLSYPSSQVFAPILKDNL